MLSELSIRNFAIIDDLNIQFTDGLTILSGETGAGKSIIINAVNLLLGSRATARLIRSGAHTAELEALFEIVPKSMTAQIMTENGYDPSEGLLIRRIISSNDRHRIYINGRLATMQLLASITENLASISGQHAHQNILKEEQHMLILDRLGGLMPFREKVFICFHDILPLINKLKKLKSLEKKQTEHIEFLEFQKNEIEASAIMPDEDTRLEQEKNRLKNAGTLYATIHGSIEALYSGHGAVSEKLSDIKKSLEMASCIDAKLTSTAEKVADVSYRIEDISEGLRHYLQATRIDDKRLEEVEERLDTLSKLKRKYGRSLKTIENRLEAITMELAEIQNLGQDITETENELSEKHKKLERLAVNLSEKREKTAEKIAKKVEKELASLKMPKTKFQVSLDSLPAGDNTDPYLSTHGKAINESGIDRAFFLIAPNVGEEMKPLINIASGGELSRVVLALKVIMADNESLETVVFDEVDAGIGGGVAEVVGKKLHSLARHHQIICITHLPQLAKFGDHHLRISKKVSGGRTRTSIIPLTHETRIDEIARMLGGENITKTTREHAKEMLVG
ncbi:MAG: DNA repair protein RecN [Desulfobacterales bacterium]|nr:DNA repair protein RecN [Desulfobacterales bacterium]